MTPTVHRAADREALSRAAAQFLVDDIHATLETQDTYTLALAGGSTPRRLYELLGTGAAGTVPWDRVHLFWGDERYVPHDDPKSNVHLVRETLLAAATVPAANVHPIPTQHDTPDAAATAYAETLQEWFADRTATFDTALLGLGSDGHTASLFPETSSFADDERWVRVVTAPPRHDVATRLSCTMPVLNGARQAVFLVSGERKEEAVRSVLDRRDPSLPATHVRPRAACHWFVDRAARPEGDRGSDAGA
ncbi:MAG: 6-phosphogluconolactonase [Salinivenus sp.]